MAGPPGPLRPILCLVVDREASRRPLHEAVCAAVAAGVDWLQLRERTLEGGAWLEWATALQRAAKRVAPELQVLVNRRLDIALALGADGVHLGFDAVTPQQARALLGPSAALGVSTHSPEEVRAAALCGASYAHLAPVFDPLSKPATRPALGLAALRRGCAHGIPVLAQGGLDPARCGEAVRAGAAGVAVTGAILLSEQPGEATAALRAALDRAGEASG